MNRFKLILTSHYEVRYKDAFVAVSLQNLSTFLCWVSAMQKTMSQQKSP